MTEYELKILNLPLFFVDGCPENIHKAWIWRNFNVALDLSVADAQELQFSCSEENAIDVLSFSLFGQIGNTDSSGCMFSSKQFNNT